MEARTLAGAKAPQSEQDRSVQDSEQEGFILTRYFYQRLLQFEKDSVGFRAALPAMIAGIDARAEQKRAGQIQFAASAEPELLHLSRPKEGKLLVTAEERLSAGDAQTAEKLAKQALAEKSEDPGRALFILAQIALRGKMEDTQPADPNEPRALRAMHRAQDYFERAVTHFPADPNSTIADCNEALRLDPQFAQAYTGRGIARIKLGELAAAVADFDEAIRLEPQFADAYVGRGHARQVPTCGMPAAAAYRDLWTTDLT